MTTILEDIWNKLSTEEKDLIQNRYGIDLTQFGGTKISTYKLPKDAQLVWDEYQHRHRHIWSTIFQLTYAIAFLSVIPFLKEEMAAKHGVAILLPNILAVLLSLLGSGMIVRELYVFNSVKKRHRKIHDTLRDDPKGSVFEYVVVAYLFALCAVSLCTFAYVAWYWI